MDMLDREVLQMVALVVVAVAISILGFFVFRTIHLGRKCAVEGSVHLSQHKRSVNYTFGATLLLVLAIEMFSLLSDVHMTGTWIFWVHMFFALPFVILLVVLRFYANGIQRKSIHGPLAYATGTCFLGVLFTGIYMLGNMLPA